MNMALHYAVLSHSALRRSHSFGHILLVLLVVVLLLVVLLLAVVVAVVALQPASGLVGWFVCWIVLCLVSGTGSAFSLAGTLDHQELS